MITNIFSLFATYQHLFLSKQIIFHIQGQVAKRMNNKNNLSRIQNKLFFHIQGWVAGRMNNKNNLFCREAQKCW